MEDKKWFEQHGRSDIVNAGNAAQRKRAIAELHNTDPELFTKYLEAQNDAEAMSRFIRISGRFQLTASGDIDLYPLFAEHCLNCSREAWGLILPTGIAVNDTNKAFFSKLIDDNRLVSLYDFENREALFDIHRMFKFCLLTAGKAQDKPRTVSGGFYLTRLDHLLDPARIYTLQTNDFALLNPNTKTCPVFRTAMDAQLTAKIYRRSAILQNEATGDNPWSVRFGSMLHMSGDSDCFRTYEQLNEIGAELQGNSFVLDDETYVPLYEGKMIWHYNHHYGTWPMMGERPNTIDGPELDELADPRSFIIPWYWVPQSVVRNKLMKIDNEGNVLWEWKRHWLMGYRCIARSVDERTFIACILPEARKEMLDGVGNSIALLYEEGGNLPAGLLLGLLSSIPFDYAVRQKVGGINMNAFFVKQFPVLRPEQFTEEDKLYIIPRVYELAFFNKDLQGWADELWEECDVDIQQLIVERIAASNGTAVPEMKNWQPKPCIYNEERRAVAQAELDAYYAHLYGLTTDELRYILDPEDICGVGCINETFRVLKDNEMRKYGEYRTKRMVLEAWERMGWNV